MNRLSIASVAILIYLCQVSAHQPGLTLENIKNIGFPLFSKEEKRMNYGEDRRLLETLFGKKGVKIGDDDKYSLDFAFDPKANADSKILDIKYIVPNMKSPRNGGFAVLPYRNVPSFDKTIGSKIRHSHGYKYTVNPAIPIEEGQHPKLYTTLGLEESSISGKTPVSKLRHPLGYPYSVSPIGNVEVGQSSKLYASPLSEESSIPAKASVPKLRYPFDYPYSINPTVNVEGGQNSKLYTSLGLEESSVHTKTVTPGEVYMRHPVLYSSRLPSQSRRIPLRPIYELPKGRKYSGGSFNLITPLAGYANPAPYRYPSGCRYPPYPPERDWGLGRGLIGAGLEVGGGIGGSARISCGLG